MGSSSVWSAAVADPIAAKAMEIAKGKFFLR